MPLHRKTFIRQDIIADLLYQVLQGTLPHDITFTPLPDNYLLIDEILLIPQFQQYACSFEDLVEVVHADSLLRFSVRGSKVRLKPPELNQDRNVVLSKKLAWILRHGAEKTGLQYREGGYLYLDEVLQLSAFSGFSVEDVRRVVEVNDKRRYDLSTEPGTSRLRIRAFQGHSVPIEGLELTPIVDASQFPTVIHGTYFKNWETIRTEGLKRMARTHIHFAPGETGDAGVISGMRASAEVLIYIDLAKAMQDGIHFYLSENQVILSEGDANGCLPPKYFTAAYQRHPRLPLPLV
ncbi:hypothetical protein P879_10237 [Paragonimus westermani]|uniref:2'-phosphotransferase n=1 Tax=Paragonimus westermani TaxID=34504 RepID=A0A8T0DHZ9_9TREM|nr:hypothetical protein P879_10237 [Paragonimus westermani]